MTKVKKWLIPVAIVCLLLTALVGCSNAPASLGQIYDPSGNPFANRFTDVSDLRTATYVVAASDSVHKFEADYRCNGTNDHVQIQAAIDALPAGGGEVKLLEGTFNVEASINLDSNQTLSSCGRNTILTTSTAGIAFLSAIGGAGTEKTGIVIADLQIDGGVGTVSSAGIHFTYVDYSFIQNVYSRRHSDYGIFLENSDFNTIVGNTCRWNTRGIYLYNSSSNTIVGNTCRENGEEGIYLDASSNNTVSGNTLTENSQDVDNTYDDIFLYDSDYNNIQGNTCRRGGELNKPRYGINISNDNCDRNCLIGNDLYDSGSTGDLNDVPTTNPTLKHDNRNLAGTGWLAEV